MDLAVLISIPLIALFGIMGYRDGVVKRVLEIVGVLVVLVLTARFATAVHPWVMEKTGVPEGAALLITWAGLFFAGLLLSRFLASMISKLVRLTIVGWLDKIGGAVVGLAFGTLFASVILIVISQVPGGQAVKASYEDAPLGHFIYYAAPNFYQQAHQLFGEDADELWDRVLEETREQREAAERRAREAVDDAVDEAKEKAADAVDKAAGN